MKKAFGSVAAVFAMVTLLATAVLMQACSPAHFIGKEAVLDLVGQPGLPGAQVGISVYDPGAARYLYDFQGDKFFIPASNVKLFTLYSGLKNLGDSLAGIRYWKTDTAIFIIPSGDPTLLHPDFPRQPVIDLLQRTKKKIWLVNNNWQDKALGKGWAWDDYNEDYAAERSSLPVYGNTIRWVQEWQRSKGTDLSLDATPSFYSLPEVDWKVRFNPDGGQKKFLVERERDENVFRITGGEEKYKTQDVPFITHGVASALVLLKDTVGKIILVWGSEGGGSPGRGLPEGGSLHGWLVLHSQPVDSLFRPMMWRSDNFFAEQTLLMVSNERFGVMNDARIIDTLLNGDLNALPQRPVWADGSGLSRYDLFSPRDFVWLLDKMSREFGLARMERLLPSGGEGTLGAYYKKDSGTIFAKTGSMSGVVSLCGWLVTKRNRLLIFSILVNNHSGGATAVRRKIERLVEAIRNKY